MRIYVAQEILDKIKEEVIKSIGFHSDIAVCPACGCRINLRLIKGNRKYVRCPGCNKRLQVLLLTNMANNRYQYAFKDDIEHAFDIATGDEL